MAVGVLGGSFDPVHEQHVKIALHAVRQLGLERLVVVPTYSAPHKEGAFESYFSRRKQAEAAFSDFEVPVDICDIEYELRGKSYLSRTLSILQPQYGEIYFILGGDSLLAFDTWHEPAEILKHASLAVCGRVGYDGLESKASLLQSRYGGRIVLVDYVGEAVSSGQLRARLLLGEPVEGIPSAAMEAIRSEGMYSRYRTMAEQVRARLTPARYAHTVRTVLTAVRLNRECNLRLDFDKVFRSALLHDVGKHDETVRAFVPQDSIGTKVEHQFAGAIIAESQFGVEESDILDAIRYHTTARPNMSKLEKLIFVADMIEPEREYAEVEELRGAIAQDFDRGVAQAICASYRWLKEKKVYVYPLTAEAYEYYKGDII